MFPSSFMKPTQSVFITFLLSIAWFGCQPDTHPGEALARQYCGSCHAFPEPFLLPKKSWELQVLPAMGKLMGLQFFNGVPYQDVYDEVKGTLPVSDWQRIVDYYRSVAPEAMPSQKRAPVKEKTDQFEVLTPAMETQPATVF